jgi:hypothetical protein
MKHSDSSSSLYLTNGRLADILALIQVLALDKDTHRSEEGLAKELQGPPRSADYWSSVAKAHPEFFRVKGDKENPVSLIARHVIPKDDKGIRQLSPDYVSKLMSLAIELHDREATRAKSWHIWLPVFGVLLGGTLALLGSWLKK